MHSQDLNHSPTSKRCNQSLESQLAPTAAKNFDRVLRALLPNSSGKQGLRSEDFRESFSSSFYPKLKFPRVVIAIYFNTFEADQKLVVRLRVFHPGLVLTELLSKPPITGSELYSCIPWNVAQRAFHQLHHLKTSQIVPRHSPRASVACVAHIRLPSQNQMDLRC